MAGAMRRMAVYLGLVEDDPDYPGYDHDQDDARGHDTRSDRLRDERIRDDRVRPTVTEGRTVRHLPDRTGRDDLADRRTVGLDRRPTPVAVTTTQEAYRITTIHPRTYNDAKRIGEEFREGTAVIMNLTELDDADAKRIVDFSAGLIFGLHGSIERVTSKVFLLSPTNVVVSAEARAQMVQDGFFNQS